MVRGISDSPAAEAATISASCTIDRTFSAPINATSFTATNLTPNTTYYFRIRGTNLEGEGAPLVASVTTAQQNTRPSAPTNLTARQKDLLKEFEKAGKTSPESEGFFSKVKEMFSGD